MRPVVVLALERDGRRVPLAHTFDPDVAALVARAVLDGLRLTVTAETNEIMRALVQQEANRLRQAFMCLGIVAK